MSKWLMNRYNIITKKITFLHYNWRNMILALALTGEHAVIIQAISSFYGWFDFPYEKIKFPLHSYCIIFRSDFYMISPLSHHPKSFHIWVCPFNSIIIIPIVSKGVNTIGSVKIIFIYNNSHTLWIMARNSVFVLILAIQIYFLLRQVTRLPPTKLQ